MENSRDYLDSEIIDQLKGLAEDDKEFIQNLFDTFKTNASMHLDSLKLQVRDENYDSLKRSAHQLKGCSANMGAKRLQQLCAKLEGEIKEQETGQIPKTINNIEFAFQSSLLTLKEVFEIP